MLCLISVYYHPWTVWSMDIGTVSNHTSSSKQVHTHICGNLNKMFVAELVVVTSVNYSYSIVWKVCLFSHTPEEYCTRVVSSAHTSIYAQEEHCNWVVSSVHDIVCPVCLCSPSSQMLACLMMFITGKMIFIIALLFVWKSRTILAPSWTWFNHDVICWLDLFFCITTSCDRNS